MEQSTTADLTGKARLAFEACQKISTGERLVQEGRIELANLFPEKTVAHRTLRDRGQGLFRKDDRTDDELISIIMEMIKKGERVTANLLRKRLRISDSRVTRIRSKLRKVVSDRKVPGAGQSRVWFLARTTKKSAKKPAKSTTPIDQNRIDEVLRYLKSDTWITLDKARKDLKIEWYCLNKIVRHLVNQGLARSIRKTGNPAHKGVSAYNRELTYWEAT